MARILQRQAWFWWCIRRLVSLRYDVTVDGIDKIRKLDGPTLILPNHPAYIDPAIVQSYLRFGSNPRPLVFEGTFRRWFLRPIMRVVRAVEVPDLTKASREAYRKTVEIIRDVAEGVDQGESYLLYPSGRLQRGNQEFVGGARAASEIITRCPNVNIVLVRVSGLWGSMFGCARTGDLPNLGRTFLKAIGWLFAGGIFFLPRRRVHVFVDVVDRSELPGLDRRSLNRYLEDWYNIHGTQEPKFVPYHWVWRKNPFPVAAQLSQNAP